MPHSNVSRAEAEFNHGWMRNNPDLFVAQVIDFQTRYPYTDWLHCASMHRHGFITLIAHRRDTPFVETQYLNEIGMAR